MNHLEALIRSGKAVVIDVRTPAEFACGHVKDSINMPLPEIPRRLNELRNMENIVLCCASGGRSGQAASYLEQNGIACVNGGPWMNLASYC